MDDPNPSMGRIARPRAIAGEVRDFAEVEATASRVPGQDQAPADAYRHLVGVAEPSRRAGPLLAAAMAERNEWASTEAMLHSILGGRPIAPSNMPAARAMDRHNNLLAVGIFPLRARLLGGRLVEFPQAQRKEIFVKSMG